ncbi:hypothetical protein MBANPS3_008925 [Mucor bainieri]
MSDLTNNNNSAINPNAAKNRKKKAKKKAKRQNTTDSSNTASEISTPNLTDKENLDPIVPVAPSTTAIITEAQTTPVNTSTLTGEGSALATSLPAKSIDDSVATGNNGASAIITEAQTTPANTSALTGEGSAIATSLPAKSIDTSVATATTATISSDSPAIITETQTTPANTSTLTGEGSALATSLPAKPIDESAVASGHTGPAVITEAQTTPENTSTLTGEGSALATSLPAKPIDGADVASSQAAPNASTSGPIEGSIHDKNIPAAGPVGPGAAGATAAGAAIAAATVGASTAATSHSGGGSASLPEPLPLSDNVQYAIKSVIASRSIDLYSIVDKIKSNVAAGDYKEKAKLPPNASNVDKKQPQVPTAVNTDASVNPKAAVGTPNNAPAAITTNKDTSDSSSKNPLKKAAAGVGAAVAGATAAVAGSHKSGNNDNNNTAATNTATDSKINNKSAPLPPAPQTATNASASTTSGVSKLSENVQYCIKSVVQAPSVDVYGIIDPSQRVKRPEAAVGPSTQPTMPSSAKAPDVPKKTTKSPEHRNKPSFLKKKNCIIFLILNIH